MVIVVASLGLVGVVVAFTIGPAVILRVFGPEFPVDRRTVGLLAAASACYMLANTLAQALIALGGAAQVAVGWGFGVVAMVVVVAVGDDPLFTVEMAFLVATAVAAAGHGPDLASGPCVGERHPTDERAGGVQRHRHRTLTRRSLGLGQTGRAVTMRP